MNDMLDCMENKWLGQVSSNRFKVASADIKNKGAYFC